MGHMDIQVQLGETHLPSNTKSLYKVHLACDHPLQLWPLGGIWGSALQEPPRTPGPGEGDEAITELQATG